LGRAAVTWRFAAQAKAHAAPVLPAPDPVDDLEAGKHCLDEYGMFIHRNVLSPDEVAALAERANVRLLAHLGNQGRGPNPPVCAVAGPEGYSMCASGGFDAPGLAGRISNSSGRMIRLAAHSQPKTAS